MPQLQWKGAPAPRARKIPQEIWEQYREELCEMYEKYTLDRLMTIMIEKHNFAASRRQYIFQFEKWGTHKYKVSSKDNKQSGQRFPQQASSHPKSDLKLEIIPELANTSQTSLAKRQRSLRDAEPLPAKRQILSDQRLQVGDLDSLANLGKISNRDPQPSSQYSVLPEAVPQRTMEHSTLPEPVIRDALNANGNTKTEKDMDNFNFENFEPAFFLENDVEKATQVAENDAQLARSNSDSHHSALINEIFQRWANKQHSGTAATQQDVLFDINRPIDTFSHAEMENMKCAADFLFALNFRKDAFALYVLLLKRVKVSTHPHRARVTSSHLIACVRSAVLPNQAAIVRNLLQQEIDSLGSGTIEEFTYEMLLADTYLRFHDESTANSHIHKAMLSNPFEESLIDDLPETSRYLDLITYQFIVDGIARARTRALDVLPSNYFSLDKDQVQDQILERVPGPFELKQGVMKNRCIKSCLEWCASALEHEDVIPGLWSTVESRHYSNLNEDRTDWTRLFCYLWQRWQRFYTKRTTMEPPLWAEAESLMGISAAEHLVIICPMILNAAPHKVDYSQGARHGAWRLCEMPDADLGLKYLEMFSRRNKWLRGTDGDEILALSNPLCSESSDTDNSSLNTERAYTPPTSLGVVAATLVPTMASSMDSSDLSSFRHLRDRIRHKVTGTRSNEVRHSTYSNGRISMDQLSQTMASSLNISLEPGYGRHEDPYRAD
ncbi:hypothetical protein B0O99DRAFT_685307 [Bisporella sp. PMI_857]|nr:hypothetical protein B0O99DRAFT_685307 [Bisporella sp. PMI_857]